MIQDDIFDSIVSLLNSNKLDIRRETVTTVSNMITTLESSRLNDLVFDKYPNLMHDYLRNLTFTTNKRIIFPILDSLEYLFGLDEQYGLQDEHSFSHLIETNNGFDLLEKLMQGANDQIYTRAEYVINTYIEGDRQEAFADNDDYM